MIADQEALRHGQVFQALLQPLIGLDLAPIGEVAGDDREIGVGVMPVDVVDRLHEMRMRIPAQDRFAGQGDVHVGEVNELHR